MPAERCGHDSNQHIENDDLRDEGRSKEVKHCERIFQLDPAWWGVAIIRAPQSIFVEVAE